MRRRGTRSIRIPDQTQWTGCMSVDGSRVNGRGSQRTGIAAKGIEPSEGELHRHAVSQHSKSSSRLLLVKSPHGTPASRATAAPDLAPERRHIVHGGVAAWVLV